MEAKRMMHENDVIVAIVDATTHKPYRESNFSSTKNNSGWCKKSCELVVPFGIEFAIMVKNHKRQRIIMDIYIDGSSISESGIIIDAGDTVYLERSTTRAKKFKFVKANDERVSDPTNSENGKIHAIIRKEYEPRRDAAPVTPTPRPDPFPQPYWAYNDKTYNFIEIGSSDATKTKGDNTTLKERGTTYDSRIMNLCSFAGDGDGQTNGNIEISSRSTPVVGETGATVEGSDSQQAFNTTHWSGTDFSETIEFSFTMRGSTEMSRMSAKDQKEFQKYQELKQKFES